MHQPGGFGDPGSGWLLLCGALSHKDQCWEGSNPPKGWGDMGLLALASQFSQGLGPSGWSGGGVYSHDQLAYAPKPVAGPLEHQPASLHLGKSLKLPFLLSDYEGRISPCCCEPC